MAETFSLGLTGISANHRPSVVPTITVGDTDQAGNVVGTYGQSQQQEMRTNTPILCKGPDGLLTYHVIDAERSIPGVSIILRKV